MYATANRYKDRMKTKDKPVVNKLYGASKSIKGLTILNKEALRWVGIGDGRPQGIACLLQGGLQLRFPVRSDGELSKVIPSQLEASGATRECKEPIFKEGEGRVGSNMYNHASISTLLLKQVLRPK